MLPPPLQRLLDQIDAVEADARAIVDGLTDADVNWQAQPGKTWSIAQCLDHVRATDESYLPGFLGIAEEARAAGRGAFRGLQPTAVGRWFVGSLEPPVKFRARAPRSVVPASNLPQAVLVPAFETAHAGYRRLIELAADVDVNRVVGPNPFFGGIRMRLATVLLLIPAHDRRHLWQARQVREALGHQAGGSRPAAGRVRP